MSKFRQYLGDSVYCDFDGYNLILTTNNGLENTNTIELEPEVYANLLNYLNYVQALKETLEQAK